MRRASIPLALLIGFGCSDPASSQGTSGADDESTFGSSVADGDTTTGPTTTDADGTTTLPADETTSTSDDGPPFIVAPDGGNPNEECDLWIDDCPRGEKCMPWATNGQSWDATKCSPLAEDPKGVGEPCSVEGNGTSGVDDCGPRSMCWNVDADTLMGECVGFCVGSEQNPTCEDPCKICPITSNGFLLLCLPTCDPLLQNCLDGLGCYALGDTFGCTQDASGDAGALGENCEFLNVCDPGLFCASPETVPNCEGNGCCAQFCDALDANPCNAMPPGVVCIPWFDDGEALQCVSGVVGGCLLPE